MPKPVESEAFIGLRVDPAEKQRSLAAARQRGCTLSEWIREALAEKACRDLQRKEGQDYDPAA